MNKKILKLVIAYNPAAKNVKNSTNIDCFINKIPCVTQDMIKFSNAETYAD